MGWKFTKQYACEMIECTADSSHDLVWFGFGMELEEMPPTSIFHMGEKIVEIHLAKVKLKNNLSASAFTKTVMHMEIFYRILH